jgi:hypothetical protein
VFVAVPDFVLSGDRSLASLQRIWQRSFASDVEVKFLDLFLNLLLLNCDISEAAFFFFLSLSFSFFFLGVGNKIVVLVLNSSAICYGVDAVWIFRDCCKKFVYLLCLLLC